MACSKCIFHDETSLHQTTTGNSQSKDVLSNYCTKLSDPDVFAINQTEALIKYKTVLFKGFIFKVFTLINYG